MIAKTVLSLTLLVLAFVLVRALIKGRIEFNAAGGGMVAHRATQPGSFWTFFILGTCAMAYLAWLLFGA